MRRLLRWTLILAAFACPLAIVAITLALAFIGEQWWPTTLGLYLPRALFAAPTLCIGIALLLWGPRRLLLLQAAATIVLLFPLMGLSLHGAKTADGPTLSVLSYNTDYGHVSRPEVIAQLIASDADVIVLQAVDRRINAPLQVAMPERHTHSFDQFFVASRFPILEVYEPTALEGSIQPAFMRVTLDTPLGPLDIYVVHPESPRRGFEAIRGEGLRQRLTTGESFSEQEISEISRNTAVRMRQVEALAAHARSAQHPVIIAGDTNLPALSPLFRAQFSEYQDGWSEVGAGFGYTFPAHKWLPWMRIDRILAGKGLRFVDFAVGDRHGSDHLSVKATLCASALR
jgi:endonuclease/exonuclease/phosphatase (EEP) superfamily protein YafD